MKDPICKRVGCYMFAADTPERAGCEKACRLQALHLAAANDPRELSGRLTTDTGRFTPHLLRSDKTRKVVEVAESVAKWGVLATAAKGHGSDRAPYERCPQSAPGIDYAALEMRVMADLMNKKEGE